MGFCSDGQPPNNSFKPNLLRCTKHMAERACHVFGSTTQVGLTQALGIDDSLQCDRHFFRHTSGCARMLPFAFLASFSAVRQEAAPATSRRLFPQCHCSSPHCTELSCVISGSVCCCARTGWHRFYGLAALRDLRRCMLVVTRPRQVPGRPCLSKAAAQCLTIRSSRDRFAARLKW